jgi:hypothetical protein
MKMKLLILITMLLSASSILVLEANAWVESPSIIQGTIVSYWEQTGTDHIQIMLTGKKLLVNVTNSGTVVASANLIIRCDVGKVGLYPLDQTVSVSSGETKTAYFSVSNLGIEEQIDNIPITITMHETYGGTEVAQETVYATLLATLGQEQTNLKILTLEKGTDKPAVGVQLTVLYPANGQGEQEQQWTNTKGEADLTFEVGYNGDIAIQATESDAYFAKNITSAYISAPTKLQ